MKKYRLTVHLREYGEGDHFVDSCYVDYGGIPENDAMVLMGSAYELTKEDWENYQRDHRTKTPEPSA